MLRSLRSLIGRKQTWMASTNSEVAVFRLGSESTAANRSMEEIGPKAVIRLTA